MSKLNPNPNTSSTTPHSDGFTGDAGGWLSWNWIGIELELNGIELNWIELNWIELNWKAIVKQK